jgi:transcriptional regulator with XRE-family HTH domain
MAEVDYRVCRHERAYIPPKPIADWVGREPCPDCGERLCNGRRDDGYQLTDRESREAFEARKARDAAIACATEAALRAGVSGEAICASLEALRAPAQQEETGTRELGRALRRRLTALHNGSGPDRDERYQDAWRQGVSDATDVLAAEFDTIAAASLPSGDGERARCADCGHVAVAVDVCPACGSPNLAPVEPGRADWRDLAAIGELLRARRTALGLSLHDLGEKLGVAPTTLSRVERGLGTSWLTAVCILDWLDVPAPSPSPAPPSGETGGRRMVSFERFERLWGALTFYADEAHYERTADALPAKIMWDAGKVARDALDASDPAPVAVESAPPAGETGDRATLEPRPITECITATTADGKQVWPPETGDGRGVELIAAERRRQVEAEGYDAAHDDEHGGGELAQAAAAYAWPGEHMRTRDGRTVHRSVLWPWDGDGSWRPGDRLRDLTRAGALIAAEIDRLERVRDLPSEGARA